MISYEEALERARRLKGFFDICTETENAWIFHTEEEETNIGTGACCVIKETGECLNYMGYIWHPASVKDREIRRFMI